jgi:DNA processing protein
MSATSNAGRSADVRAARIALAYLAEPGRRDLGTLVRAEGPVRAIHRLLAGRVGRALRDAVAGRIALLAGEPALAPGSTVDYGRLAAEAEHQADRHGARIITPEDDEWPAQLADLTTISRGGGHTIARDTDPPHALWLRGPQLLADSCTRAVAVVGSRASTSYGNHVAGELGHDLADRGWTIVSGGAFGIDAAAHQGALAAGGPTVAVLACGIDRAYPASHARLFEQIGEQALLLTEWPPGADPHRHRFLVRNRVIAALAQGTVLVEAGLRSGARFTLARARLLNRHVMAVPGPVTSAMSVGSHEELRIEGTTLVTGAAHVIEVVGRIGLDLAPVPRAEPTPQDALTTLQRQILDGVRPRKLLTAEQIAAAVGVSTRDVRRALPALEPFVTPVDGGYRLRRKSDPPPKA